MLHSVLWVFPVFLPFPHFVTDSQQKSRMLCVIQNNIHFQCPGLIWCCVCCAGSAFQRSSCTNTSSHPAAGAVEMDRSEADAPWDQTTALKDRARPGEQEHKQPVCQEVTHLQTTYLTCTQFFLSNYLTYELFKNVLALSHSDGRGERRKTRGTRLESLSDQRTPSFLQMRYRHLWILKLYLYIFNKLFL